MYIVWRKKPITTNRKVELFFDYWPLSVQDLDGTRKRTRRKNTDWRPPWLWNPINCRHRGQGRIAWTPLLMHAARIEGKPRQKLLHRFPTLRTCCMKEPFILAAWWYAIEDKIRYFEEDDDRLAGRLIARDKKAILEQLRKVAPRPTRKGVQEFTTFRQELEAEEKRIREEELEEWRREQEESQRRAAEEQRRREESARRVAEETWRLLEKIERNLEESRRRQEELDQVLRARQREWEESQRQRAEQRRAAEEQRRAAEEQRRAAEEQRQHEEQQRREEQRRQERRTRAMQRQPWWEVLELPKEVSQEEVKRRFQELAWQHHPDQGGDPKKFMRAREAYEQAMEWFRR
jgi:hypothetical protein